MRSLEAEDIEVRRTETGRELRFTGILANAGKGPLVLRPDEQTDCPEGQRHASQLVYRDANGDGSFDPEADTRSEVVPAGCVLFHPNHDHWHFDASARYELIRPGGQDPVVAQDKVSFCMRDSRRLTAARWADAAETYDECERDEIQGITAGWADVYDAELDGQALELPDDANGVYCLRITADPFELLRETNDDDNSSVIAVELTGDEATRLVTSDPCALP